MTQLRLFIKNGHTKGGKQQLARSRKEKRSHVEMAAKAREYRKRNPDYAKAQIAAMKARREERRVALDSLKSGSCTDCGGRFPPECMDFDHVRGEKKFGVNAVNVVRAWDLVMDELAKCELVCSNCHRIRTKNGKAR